MMDAQTISQIILYAAAVLQMAAAIVALLFIPLSGKRWFWILIAAALLLQSWRRIVLTLHAPTPETLSEATTALLVSAMLLAGIIGLRALLVTETRESKRLKSAIVRSSRYVNWVEAMIVYLDPEGKITWMNAEACMAVGCDLYDVLGMDWFETFVSRRVRDRARTGFAELVESEDADDAYVEYAFVDMSGEEHEAVWHRRVLRDDEGEVVGIRSAGIDVTDRKRMEEELSFRSMLLDQTSECVLATDLDGTIVYANEALSSLKGVSQEKLVGTDIHDLLSQQGARDLDALLQILPTTGSASMETSVTNRDGREVPIELRAHLMADGTSSVVVFVAVDVTQRKEAEKTIRHMAYHDDLTGLPNRSLLVDRAEMVLGHARRHQEPASLIFVDVDNLKCINDTLGHGLADEVLKTLAKRLVGAFRDGDTIARFGGDEFVILLPYTNAEAAGRAAQKILDLGREKLTILGEEIEPKMSVGVSVYPRDGDSLDRLLAGADAAMYAAKRGGRDQFRFFSAREPESVPE
jgi:diguanylate cyclase (GGDEF)-like protein/PAS domain S-box-containing protein